MKGDKETNVIAMGGDGASFDIGFGSLSGAIERGHKFLYVCTDNEAYMNTGIQRSGATFPYANTTTSPAGKVIPGKQQPKNWATKRRTILGLAKKRKKKVVAKEEAKAEGSGK